MKSKSKVSINYPEPIHKFADLAIGNSLLLKFWMENHKFTSTTIIKSQRFRAHILGIINQSLLNEKI